jgi:hypothetical protein
MNIWQKVSLALRGENRNNAQPTIEMNNDFETNARTLAESIVVSQNSAAALYNAFLPEAERINTLLQESGIAKSIEWNITLDETPNVTLSASDKVYLELQAEQDGTFLRTRNYYKDVGKRDFPYVGEKKTSKKGTCKDIDEAIEWTNVIIQKELLTEEELIIVRATLHEQKQHNAMDIAP